MALYKRNKIYWISFTTPNGERIRCSAKTSDRKEAQELLDKMKHESWRVQKLGERPRHTWDEAALLWLKEKSQKKSIKSDMSLIRYLTGVLRGRYLDGITRADLIKIAEDKCLQASPSTANRYLSLIHAILNRAKNVWEWIDKVPRIQRYKEPPRRLRYLLHDEIDRLMKELPEYLRPVQAFALLTGLRRGNILNLKWEQVDMELSRIVIGGDEMKNGQHHTVYLSDHALETIKEQRGKHPVYVFTRNGKKIVQANKAFKSALKRAGITDYRFHDNRHTWASALIQNGVTLYELQEMGGWKSAEMVKRYAHLSAVALKKNAELVASVLYPDGTKRTHGE